MSEFIEPFDLPEGSEQRALHIGRYRWAKEVIRGMVVANAACSSNYGSELLSAHGRLVIGFDRNDAALDIARSKGRLFFIKRDIQEETFEGFTTLVCLETFEHLERPWDFLKNLHGTVKELVLSTPIIPTKHMNEWHLHDFTKQEVRDGLAKHGWAIKQEATQEEGGREVYLLIYATR